jgi:hypothetical protein
MGEPLKTVYGWKVFPDNLRPTTAKNFALQANGAEMLRLAVIALTERSVAVCAMVHDAVLIEASIDEIDATIALTRDCMAAASRAVLAGFEIGTDVEVYRYPNRFTDKRGLEMWDKVTSLVKHQTIHEAAG